MSTTTETQTQTGSRQPVELTILARVASIPMIQSSLGTINDALSSNAYTRSSYCSAKELSTTAYKYTEPLQVRLAPFLMRADGYANKAVDVVESRYPYPFKAKPEEVASLVRERRESATHYVNECVNEANKAIDEKVKNPAYNVAQGIDQRFAPIVDYFEVAVSKINGSEAGPSQNSDAKYQYQRAISLSRTLKDNLYGYSNEQIKHLQTQSILLQRATETSQNITNIAASSVTSAQAHIHALSEKMISELQKLQASTASLSASLQSTASSTLHASTQQLPPQIQQTYADITAGLSSAVTELASIVTTKDLPIQEKVGRVGKEVRERVTPLLENLKNGVSELLSRKHTETAQPNSTG